MSRVPCAVGRCILVICCIFFKNVSFLAALSLACGLWRLHCCRWDLSLWRVDSSHGTEFSGCGMWALCSVACGLSYYMPCCILVPQPGIELMAPALQGRFLTIGPPGKSRVMYFKCSSVYLSIQNSLFIPPLSSFLFGNNHKFVF